MNYVSIFSVICSWTIHFYYHRHRCSCMLLYCHGYKIIISSSDATKNNFFYLALRPKSDKDFFDDDDIHLLLRFIHRFTPLSTWNQGCESRRQTFMSISRPRFREIWKVSALPRSLTLLGKKVSPGSGPLFGFSRPNPAGNEIPIANR